MEEEIKTKPRRKFNIHDNVITIFVVSVVLFILSGFVAGAFMMCYKPTGEVGQSSTLYLAFIGNWVVMILYMLISRRNRPILRALGTGCKGNNIKCALIGLAVGFGMNAFCAAVAALNGDIKLHFDSLRPGPMLFLFVAVFIQSSAEELMCRGFIYQRLRRAYKHPAVAIIGNSLFFAMLHLGNNGVTAISILQIIGIGVLFALMVYYMDSIWAPMMAHTAWNYTQNIILGLPNSGNVVPFSMMKLDAATATGSFAYNVAFGLEGSVTAVVVVSLTCAALWYWGRKNGRKPTEIWPNEENNA